MKNVVGATEQALEQVRWQPWVKSVQVSPESDDKANWSVAVTDSPMAEAYLLRLILAEPQACVLDFRRCRYELEDVFMQIVEGDNDR